MKEEEALIKADLETYFEFHDLMGGGDIVGFNPIKRKKSPLKVPEKREVLSLALPANLQDLQAEVKIFEGCALKRFATNTVFGEGVADAKIFIIGEAPGEEEDINGIPFCGRSGTLLTKALYRVLKLKRDKNFYITNSVFWRPPGNRKPTSEEMLACRPFIERMIKIIKPELIICIGSVAVQSMINTSDSVSSLRKKELEFQFKFEAQEKLKVVTLYHPSYLLRSPAKKREMYVDMLWLKNKYPNLFN
jgi:DNA polymerase